VHLPSSAGDPTDNDGGHPLALPHGTPVGESFRFLVFLVCFALFIDLVTDQVQPLSRHGPPSTPAPTPT
jgi:hypothetical protein